MIANILFFALGFLTATLLALLVAPAFWRRAVSLTRRRVEAASLLSRSELQAERDRLRAEHAMALRRSEMNLQAARRQHADQAVELGRCREQMAIAIDARRQAEAALADLEGRLGEHEASLVRHGEERDSALGEVESLRALLDEKSRELAEISVLYEDLSYSSSSRQIELVAREADVDRLEGELAALRSAPPDGAEEPSEAGDTEAQRLRSRLAVISRENRRLREQARDEESPQYDAAMARENTLLREEIVELAAQIVQLTALVGDEDSPLQALSEGGEAEEASPPSLADRIRALRAAVE